MRDSMVRFICKATQLPEFHHLEELMDKKPENYHEKRVVLLDDMTFAAICIKSDALPPEYHHSLSELIDEWQKEMEESEAPSEGPPAT